MRIVPGGSQVGPGDPRARRGLPERRGELPARRDARARNRSAARDTSISRGGPGGALSTLRPAMRTRCGCRSPTAARTSRPGRADPRTGLPARTICPPRSRCRRALGAEGLGRRLSRRSGTAAFSCHDREPPGGYPPEPKGPRPKGRGGPFGPQISRTPRATCRFVLELKPRTQARSENRAVGTPRHPSRTHQTAASHLDPWPG